MNDTTATAKPLTVLYDGKCPMCVSYWAKQKRSAQTQPHKELVEYIDWHKAPELVQKHKITQEALNKDVYAVTSEGDIIKGVDVFYRFDRIRGKKWGWLIASPRVIQPIIRFIYIIVARNRIRISKILRIKPKATL